MPIELKHLQVSRGVCGSNDHVWFEVDRGRRTALRLTRWEAGLVLERGASDSPQWIAVRSRFPGLRLFSAAEVAGTDPLREFLDEIPVEVRKIAAPIAWQQFAVLRLCRRDARAIELGRTNRCLVWLLANSVEGAFNRYVTEILGRGRPEILRELFGPRAGTEARVRVLAKLQGAVLDERLMAPLRAFMTSEQVPDVLLHMPTIPAALLIASHVRMTDLEIPFVRRALLGDPSAGEITELFRNLEDTRCTAHFLCIDNLDARLQGCRDPAALVRLHDELVAMRRGWWTVASIVRRIGNAFPAPPLKGTSAIIPITTVEDLAQERAEMQHCCLSYVDRIREGRCYLYRVLAPERGTLEIDRRGPRLQISQFKLARNQAPSVAAVLAVRRWFDDAVERSDTSNGEQ